MPDKTAFFTLYEELGLEAGCSLEDFKRAYRRRVSQLHPDRGGKGADMPRLQRLNALYDTALEFHHLHGQLPGARTAQRMDDIASSAPVGPGHAAPAPTASGRRRRYLLIGASLLALSLYWLGLGSQRDGLPTLDPAGPGDSVAPGLLQAQTPSLTLGMDQALARDILGQADAESAVRWYYGASWVEFQCGKVSGWHSSSLRPLRVGQDSARAAPMQAPGC